MFAERRLAAKEKKTAELMRKIELCEDYKKKLHDKKQDASHKEWIKYYDDYILKCAQQIKEYKEEKTSSPKISFIAALVVIGILITGFLFVNKGITGFAVFKEKGYTDDVGLAATENSTYQWIMQNIGKLKSVKVSGSSSVDGSARLYIENKNNKHLVYDSRAGGSENIVGYTIAEDKLITDNKVMVNSENANISSPGKDDLVLIITGGADKNVVVAYMAAGSAGSFNKANMSVNVALLAVALLILALLIKNTRFERLNKKASLNKNFVYFALLVFVLGIIAFVVFQSYTVYKTGRAYQFMAEKSYNDIIGLSVNASSEYNWQVKNPGEIKAVKVSGDVTTYGLAKLYIVNDELKYLVFDSEQVEQTAGITGYAVLGQAADNSPTTDETALPGAAAPNETITLNLRYAENSTYDVNNDGIETTAGVVDFSVKDSSFSWAVDESKLCSRWKTDSMEDGLSTTVCYGSSDCCNFVGLASSSANWNDIFYSYYGRYGAAAHNIISSQLIYVDISLAAESPYANIYYSDWDSLKAEFYPIKQFNDMCIETCSLTGFDKNNYTLILEIDNATLNLDNISYTVEEAVSNKAPNCIKIPDQKIARNSVLILNLSYYCSDTDGDILNYSYYQPKNISIAIEGGIAAISPYENFTGKSFTYFVANDSLAVRVSNVVALEVVEAAIVEKVKKPVSIKLDDKEGRALGHYKLTNRTDGNYDLELSSLPELGAAAAVKESKASIKNIKNLDAIGTANIHIDKTADKEARTDVFAVEESLDIDDAEITLVKEGDVNAVVYCSDFDANSFSCINGWQRTSIPFTETEDTITFTVSGFTAYAGGFYENITGIKTWTTQADFNTGTYYNITSNITGIIKLESDNNTINSSIPTARELTNESGMVLLMHFNNDSNVGENYNNSDGSIVYDYSGLGNNGTLYVGAAGSGNFTSGKFGGTFSFGESNDYVSINDSPSLDGMQALTLEAWVKWNGGADLNWDHIISKHDGSGLGVDSYYLAIDNNSRLRFIVQQAPDIAVVSAVVVTTGAWHHLVGTYNGSNASVYIDGVKVGTRNGSGSVADGAQSLSIGRYGQGDYGYFNGTIDEVAIYNRSLNTSEISDHYKKGLLYYSSGLWNASFDAGVSATFGNISWAGDVSHAQELVNDSNTVLLMHFSNDSSAGENYNISNNVTFVYDYSSANNSGYAVGNITWNATAGRFGGAFIFDGANDYINVSESILIINTTKSAHTLEAWFKANNLSATNYIFESAGGGNSYFGLRVDSTTLKFFYGDLTSSTLHNTGKNITTDRWYYAAVVVNPTLTNNDSIKIYLDGVLIAQFNDTRNSSYQETKIGSAWNAGGDKWNGTIDEVRILNRSLTADEVWSSYSKTRIKARTRTASTQAGLSTADWSQWYTENSSINSSANRFMEVQVNLSAANTTYTPVLYDLTVNISSKPTNSSLVIWDDTDSITKTVNEQIKFYANYTNINTGNSINGTNINCSFSENSTGSWSALVNMTFNATSLLYEYNKVFASAGNFTFNASCDGSATGYAILSAVDNFTAAPLSSDSGDNEWRMFNRFLNHTGYINSSFAAGANANFTAFTANGAFGKSSPAIADGYVYIGSIDDNIYQLNASDVSQKIANYTTSIDVYSSPAVADGYVYVGSWEATGYLYQLNASNISQLIASYLTGRIAYSSPAVANGYVYIGSRNNKVYQLNASNVSQLIASYTTDSWVDSSPAVANGYVYIGSYDGNLYQLNASNISQKIANFSVNASRSSPAVANGYVYVGSTADNKTYQLNASNVSQLIATYTTLGGIESSPAVANGYVYIGSNDNKLYQLNASNISQKIANYATGGDILGSPAVTDKYIFIGSDDNKIYQLNASNVSLLIASYATNGDIDSSPVIVNGYLYVGSQDGKLYRFSSLDSIIPSIAFVSPTPANGTTTTNTSVQINISITNASDLSEFKWSWNSTNYTFYNDSLVLMFNFDNVSALGENSSSNFTADASKYGNNGNCSGMGAACNWTTGRYGSALSFDGVNDWVNLSDNSNFNFGTGSFAVTAWINFAGLAGNQNILAFYTTANQALQFAWSTNVLTIWGETSTVLSTSGFSPTINTWYYVVYVRSGNNWNIYVNGVSYASVTDTRTLNAPRDDIGIGLLPTSLQYFNGSIDELRVWNRSLSAAEINQSYMSNLYKYDTDKWAFYTNQSNLSATSYNYSGCAKDNAGNENCTETRILTRDITAPNITEVKCYNSTAWINCSSMAYGINLTQIRVNCTNNVVNVTYLLRNLDDNAVKINASYSTREGDFWYYNYSQLIQDSGNWTLNITCTDELSLQANYSENWSLPWGVLVPYIVTGNANVSFNISFNFTGGVNCTVGECSSMNATLDPEELYNMVKDYAANAMLNEENKINYEAVKQEAAAEEEPSFREWIYFYVNRLSKSPPIAKANEYLVNGRNAVSKFLSHVKNKKQNSEVENEQ